MLVFPSYDEKYTLNRHDILIFDEQIDDDNSETGSESGSETESDLDSELEELDYDDYKPKEKKNRGTKKNSKKNGGTRKKH